MIELSETAWRLFVVLCVGLCVLGCGMLAYIVAVARAAYLGERWIIAAGSYKRAAKALDDFERETNAMIARGLAGVRENGTPGQLVEYANNRESADALTRQRFLERERGANVRPLRPGDRT